MNNRAQYTPGPASGARVQKDKDKWTLILSRELRHSPEKVWQALTDPAHLGGRWPGGVGLCGGYRRALGALVLLLAPPGSHAGERLTARTQERSVANQNRRIQRQMKAPCEKRKAGAIADPDQLSRLELSAIER